MRKILVIGSSGSGKSYFSKRLGEQLRIDVIHLDRQYWKPNWTKPSKEEWKAKVAEMLKRDEWIIDGNFGGTMEMRVAAADTIIFIDLSRVLCLWRVIKRRIAYRKTTRPDMAEKCDEKVDLDFLKWVWRYPRSSKPKIEELLQRNSKEKHVIRLRSRSEVKRFLRRL